MRGSLLLLALVLSVLLSPSVAAQSNECTQAIVVGNSIARITNGGGAYVKSESFYDGYLSGDNTSYLVDALAGNTSCSTLDPDVYVMWGFAFEDDATDSCTIFSVTTTGWLCRNSHPSDKCSWVCDNTATVTLTLNSCTGGYPALYHWSATTKIETDGQCDRATLYYHLRESITDGVTISPDNACIRVNNSDNQCGNGFDLCGQ